MALLPSPAPLIFAKIAATNSGSFISSDSKEAPPTEVVRRALRDCLMSAK